MRLRATAYRILTKYWGPVIDVIDAITVNCLLESSLHVG